MRKPPALLVLVPLMLLVAGCAARGDEDPLAYMRKPLYASAFDLDRLQDDTRSDQFWVTDGSIAQVRVQVWVNATAGGARVVVKDPAGAVMLETTESADRRFMLNLGQWSVDVTGTADAAGQVDVLVTRV